MDPGLSGPSILLPEGAPPRPSPLLVQPECIPGRLAEIPAWVLWIYQLSEDRHGNRRWTKPPVDADLRPIDALDPASWMTFEQACCSYRAGGFDGIGISLGRITPPERGNAPSLTAAGLIGWDIDHTRREEDADRRALQMIARLGGYAELSPSACGYRVLGLGRLPVGRRKHTASGIECYDGDRYLTVTGHHLEGTPADLINLTESSARLHAELFPAPRDSHQPPHRRLAVTLDESMTLRLERARYARNGEKFVKLFDRGDGSGYPSDSEADQALCNLLARQLEISRSSP